MRGATRAGLPENGAVIAELVREVAIPTVGIFVGWYYDDPLTVVVGHLPTSAFHLAPMITLAYSDGADRALVVETGRRLREWIMANGFERALALNLRHTSRAFTRGLRHFGIAEEFCRVVSFRL